jgi:hypothetical protein
MEVLGGSGLGDTEDTPSFVILSEVKDLCNPGRVHRSFAAKNATQDDKSR